MSHGGMDVITHTYTHLYVPGVYMVERCSLSAIHAEQRPCSQGACEVPTIDLRSHSRHWHGAGAEHAGGTPGGYMAGGRGVRKGEDALLRMCTYGVGGTFSVCCLFWGEFGWSFFLIHVWKKVKFSIKAFFVCSFCKHLMVIG